jgi:Exocyst complex component Sec5
VNHKKSLQDFGKFFMRTRPQLTDHVLKYLLTGGSRHKGLLQACGSTGLSRSNLLSSSVLALELVYVLLDKESLKEERMVEHHRNVCKSIDIQHFKSMQLDRHILSGDSYGKEMAFTLLAIFLDTLSYDISDYMTSRDAVEQFEIWNNERLAEENDIDEEEQEPNSWNDVATKEIDFEDIEIRVAQEKSAVVWNANSRLLAQDDDDDSEDEDIDPLGLVDSKLATNDQKSNGVMRLWRRRRRRRVIAPQSLQLLSGDGDGADFSSKARMGSADTSSEDFNPFVYLREKHSSASFQQLKSGLEHLQQQVKNSSRRLQLLVKDHFDQFVHCKATIDDIQGVLRSEMNPSSSKAHSVSNHLGDIRESTETLFRGVLDRKKQSDRIRSTVTVLRTYGFLFRLPADIRASIERQDYEQAVREYQRAKSLNIEDRPENHILMHVRDETFRVIDSFRQTLLDRLDNPQAPLDEQQRIIGYLVQLECEQDPAWYFLDRKNKWICSMLDQCFDQYCIGLNKRTTEAKDDGAPISPSSSSSSPTAAKAAGRRNAAIDNSSSSINGGTTSTSTGGTGNGNTKGSDSYIVTFIRRVTDILLQNMPDFYHLAQEISSGKFVRGTGSGTKAGAGVRIVPSSTTAALDAATDVEAASAASATASTDAGTSSVSASASASTTDASSSSAMATAAAATTATATATATAAATTTTTTTAAAHAPLSLEAPATTTTTTTTTAPVQVDAVAVDQDEAAVTTEISEIIAHISSKYADTVRAVLVPGSGGGVITPVPVSLHLQLPDEVIQCVVTVLQCYETLSALEIPDQYLHQLRSLCDELIGFTIDELLRRAMVRVGSLARTEDWILHPQIAGITNLPISFHSTMQTVIVTLRKLPTRPVPSWLVPRLVGAFIECLKLYADVIHRLGFSVSTPPSTSLDTSPYISEDRKIMATISNTMYTSYHILPILWDDLLDLIPHRSHSECELAYESVESLMDILYDLLFQHYVRRKILAVNRLLKRGIVFSGIDWTNSPAPNEIRTYVLEVLLELVFVHNEVYTIHKSQVSRVLAEIMEGVSASLALFLQEIDKLDANGALQLRVEVEFIKVTMQSVLSRHASNRMSSLITHLNHRLMRYKPDREQVERRRNRMLRAMQEKTRVMFACFEAIVFDE